MRATKLSPSFRQMAESSGFRPVPGMEATQLLKVVLEDLGAMPAEQASARSPLHAKVLDALPKLSPADRKLLFSNFGLNGKRKLLFRQIAQRESVTEYTVLQRKNRAMEALRKEIWGPVPRPEPRTGLEFLGQIETLDVVNHMTDRQLGQALKSIGEAGVEAAMAAGGLAARLCDAVFDLPQQQQDILRSIYALDNLGLPGLSVGETADLFSTGRAAISFKKRDALSNLRRILTGEYQEQDDPPPPHVPLKDSMAVSLNRNNPDPEEALIRSQFISSANDVMNGLSGLHRRVMDGRFNGDETLKEIGDKVNLSSERMRQVQEEALSAIRRRCVDMGL